MPYSRRLSFQQQRPSRFVGSDELVQQEQVFSLLDYVPRLRCLARQLPATLRAPVYFSLE